MILTLSKNTRELFLSLLYLKQKEISSAHRSIELVSIHKLSNYEFIMYNIVKADIYINLGKIEESNQIIDTIIADKRIRRSKMKRWYGTALYLKAMNEIMLKNRYTDILFLTEARKIFEDLGNEILVAKTYNIEGIMHRSNNEPDLVEEAFMKSISMYRDAGLDQAIPTIYFNLGSLHKDYCSYELSLKYYNECFPITNDKQLLSLVYLERSKLFFHISKMEQSMREAQIAVDMFSELEDLKFLSESFNLLGRIHQKLKHFEAALSCYTEAIIIQKEIDINYSGKSQLNIIRLFIDQRKFDLALEFLEDELDYVRHLDNINQIKSLGKLKENILMLIAKNSDVKSSIIYYTGGKSIANSLKRLYDVSNIKKVSEFNSDSEIYIDYEDIVLIANRWEGYQSQFTNFVLKKYGISFNINSNLKSVVIDSNESGYEDFANVERENHQSLALISTFDNPFHPDHGKLIIILYGDKFHTEKRIANYIDQSHGEFCSNDDNNIQLLKFDIEQGKTKDITPEQYGTHIIQY